MNKQFSVSLNICEMAKAAKVLGKLGDTIKSRNQFLQKCVSYIASFDKSEIKEGEAEEFLQSVGLCGYGRTTTNQTELSKRLDELVKERNQIRPKQEVNKELELERFTRVTLANLKKE